MWYPKSMLTVLLAVQPAIAAETTFQGYAIAVDGTSEVRQVVHVSGTRYAIPGAPAQVVDRAQVCLSRKGSGAGVVSADRVAGRLSAVSRLEYRDASSLRMVKAWLMVEAGDGSFSVVFSKIGILQGAPGAGTDEVFAPLALGAGPAWEPALLVLIGVEKSLVDCMFN